MLSQEMRILTWFLSSAIVVRRRVAVLTYLLENAVKRLAGFLKVICLKNCIQEDMQLLTACTVQILLSQPQGPSPKVTGEGHTVGGAGWMMYDDVMVWIRAKYTAGHTSTGPHFAP